MANFPVGANTQPAVDNLNKLIAALRATGKEAGLTEKQIEELVDSTNKAGTEGVKNVNSLKSSMGGLTGSIKEVGKGFVALFAIDQLKDFALKVVDVTAQFQKLEAVLTNTLGSRSAAQQALKNIRDIAATTPFSVLELTESFVKLVNQGFKPTNAEIIKLGDLAASTGKQFDQLTEAIIDAQTGEFERLKEFGIRASKQGDQVTFTFKGIETQVDFTNKSIREYILSLGDLSGVSGSMAAISETLGGQISNLGDSWDTFLTTLGDGNKGALKGTVSLLDQALKIATDLVKTTEQQNAENKQILSGATLDRFKSFATTKEQEEFKQTIYERILKLQIQNAEAEKDWKNASYTRYQQNVKDIGIWQEALGLIGDYQKEVKAATKTDEDAAKGKAAKDREEALKKLKGAQLDVNTGDEEAIKLLRQQQKEVDELDKLYERLYGKRVDASTLDLTPEKEDTSAEDARIAKDIDNFHKAADAKAEAVDQLKNYSIMAIEEVFNYQVFSTQRELAMLDQQYKNEIYLAGDNKDAQLQLKEQFNQKAAKLQQQQAEEQREAALFQIALSEGPAIAKTADTLGFPLAIPFIAAVATLFGLQLAKTKSIPTPRFAAEGDYDIDGPGTETSDSIPYWLSKHETVTPARATKRFGELLERMVNDKNFSWGDARDIVDKNIPRELSPAIVVAKGADTYELANEIRETRKAIEKLPQNHFHWDEHGFGKSQYKNGEWTRYLKSAHP